MLRSFLLTILAGNFKLLSVFIKISGGITMCYGVCGMGPGSAAAAPFMVFFIIPLILGFVVPICLLKLFLWWRVFSKTGNSGAFALLLFAPFGTLIMLCILAFSQWPTAKTQNLA